MKLKLGAIIAAGLFVTACNDDNERSSQPILTTSISGTLLDDAPLSNAQVCFDANDNLSCDDNEFSTLTQSDGKYSFENVPTAITSKIPLLAEITTDTINEFNGLPVEKNYLLRSYSDCHQVISPLTSSVQHFIDMQYTTEDAERKIKNKLKTELSVCSDYITESTNPNLNEFDQSEYLHLYQTAHIFHGLMGINMELLIERFKDENLNHKNILPVVLHQHINQLDEIVSNIVELSERQNTIAAENVSSATPISFRFPIPIPIPIPIPVGGYIDIFGNHGSTSSYQGLNDMQQAMYLMSALENSAETNLEDFFYKAPYTVGGLYSYQEVENSQALAFQARRKNQTVRTGTYNSQRIAYPTFSFEQRIWNSQYNQFLIDDEFRSGLDILRENGFASLTSQFKRNILLYGKNQNTNNWFRRFLSSNSEAQGPFANQARLLHTQRIDYLQEIVKEREDRRLANDENYIITSKNFSISDIHIKNLFVLEDNLTQWVKVVKDDARFNNTNAHFMTVKAGSDFALFRNINCESGRVCKHIPILNTDQSGISRPGKAPLGNPIDYTLGSYDGLNSLLQPRGFSATDLPVLFDNGQDIIYAFLGVGNDAHFFRLQKNDNDEYGLYYWILSATNSATGNNVTLPAPSDDNMMITQFHRPAKWEHQNHKGRDMLVISVPEYVRRAYPQFPSKIALTSDGQGIRFGEFYQQGDIVEEQLALPHDAHDLLINSLDADKINQLIDGNGDE